MALILCPECRKKISSMAESCPHCGCPKKEIENRAKNNNVGGPGCLLLILGVVLYLVTSQESSAPINSEPGPSQTQQVKKVKPKVKKTLSEFDLLKGALQAESRAISTLRSSMNQITNNSVTDIKKPYDYGREYIDFIYKTNDKNKFTYQSWLIVHTPSSQQKINYKATLEYKSGKWFTGDFQILE